MVESSVERRQPEREVVDFLGLDLSFIEAHGC